MQPKDKNLITLKPGMVCFWADAESDAFNTLAVITNDYKVQNLVANGWKGYEYCKDHRPLELEWFVRDGECVTDLTVIDGLIPDQVTVEYANEHYPLEN